MTWVRMDDRWPYSRKLRRVEPLDRLMWATSIAYCSEQNTDGVLDGAMVEFVAFLSGVQNAYDAAARLVEAGLWELDAGRWRIHDYLEFNLSRDEREADRAKKAAAGQLGGLAKARQTTKSDATSSKPLADAKHGAKQTASKPLASNVPVRPVGTTSSSLAAPASPELATTAADTSATTDDEITAAPDYRALAALGIVAEQLARAKGARSPSGYARVVVSDPERRAALVALAAANPDRDEQWLAREHLGQPHPVEPCGNCRSVAHRTADCPIPPMERS